MFRPVPDSPGSYLTHCVRAVIAHLVERPTEKTEAILMEVRVPGAARDFSPRVNFQCSLSYGVRTAPVCNRMHQH